MRELWLIRHGERFLDVAGLDARALAELVVPGRSPNTYLRTPLPSGCVARRSLVPTNSTPRRLASEQMCLTNRHRDFRRALLLHEPPAAAATESGAGFRARIAAFLDDLPDSGRILAFTQFGVIRQILGHFIPFRDVPQAIRHCAVMRVEPDTSGHQLVVIDRHLPDE